jgi:hypothetical protein
MAGDFDCVICLSIPERRVHQCTKGHIFCAECLAGHRSSGRSTSGRCPTCRSVLPDEGIRCLIAEQQIARLPTVCRYCSADLTRGALEAHLAACPRRPTFCAGAPDGCAWEGRGAADKATHEAQCARAMAGAVINRRQAGWDEGACARSHAALLTR